MPSTTTSTFSTREPLALALYSDGTLKATPLEQFGPKAKLVKSDEGLCALVGVAPQHFGLAVTNTGRVFGLPIDRLEVSSRATKGELLTRHLKLERGERVINLLAVPGEAFNDTVPIPVPAATPAYLLEFSRRGKVKKSAIAEYKNASSAALGSLKLAAGDEVVAVCLSDGQSDYFVTTKGGQTLRFGDDKLSVQGRVGQGQIAIALAEGDEVVSVESWAGSDQSKAASTTTTGEAYLLILSAKGLIKKTALTEYPAKGRATGGVATTMLTTGDSIATTRLIGVGGNATGSLLVATGQSVVVIESERVPLLSRAKRGQPLSAIAVVDGSFSGTITTTEARLLLLQLKA